MVRIFSIYLLVINIIAFAAFGIDKLKAKKSKWRIPESSLLGLAVLGGSIGAWLGMKVWHHKTMHTKFRIGVPMIIVLQVLVWLLLQDGVWPKLMILCGLE